MKGVIEVVRKDGKAFKVGETWYSSFKTLPVKKGEEVEFDFVVNGKFNNIAGKIKVLTPTPVEAAVSAPQVISDTDRRIARSVALKAAADYFGAVIRSGKEIGEGIVESKEILVWAATFETWLLRKHLED